MKQSELADVLNMSRTSVTNIEAGRQPVYAHVLVRIAEVLSCAVESLLPGSRLDTSAELADELKKLSPDEREWAARVLGSGEYVEGEDERENRSGKEESD